MYSSVSAYLKQTALRFVFRLGPDKKSSCWFKKLVQKISILLIMFSCKTFYQSESSHYFVVLPLQMQKIPQTENLQIKTLQGQPLYLFACWHLYLITQYSFTCRLWIAKGSPYTHLVLYLLTSLSPNSWLTRDIRRLSPLHCSSEERLIRILPTVPTAAPLNILATYCWILSSMASHHTCKIFLSYKSSAQTSLFVIENESFFFQNSFQKLFISFCLLKTS